MGSFTWVTGTLADRCASVTYPLIKKLSGKVELNFLSSEIAVCYSQEAKYNGYHKLNLILSVKKGAAKNLKKGRDEKEIQSK